MTVLETAIEQSRDLRPRTKELYLQHVRVFLAFADGRGWTPGLVIDWRDDMQRRRIRPQSVNVALNALRFAAEKANRTFFTDEIKRLPVRAKSAAAIAKSAHPLTWDEGRRLVKECAGDRGRDLRDSAIITLGLRTGMLRFSMCQLRLKDLRSGGVLTFTKKGGEPHTIVLDNVTLKAMNAWVAWLAEHGIKNGLLFRSLGRERVHPDDRPSIDNQLTPDGLYRALRERARKAQLTDLHPHVFRKTFLAWAKLAGAKPHQIEMVTGHKSDGIDDSDEEIDPNVDAANMLLPSWTRDLR